MSKFLYGASVQGIQSFIFQTNKLTEIVGASELVEYICTEFFKKQLGSVFQENYLLISAAGNIKYVFDNKEHCEKFVRTFPKKVMEEASGITISQAVVELGKFDDDIQELESRLRIQRNKSITINDTSGSMVTETARRTGGVGIEYIDNQAIDKAQQQKNVFANKANIRLVKSLTGSDNFSAKTFPYDISEMVQNESQSWIAVVHADGNNLGKKLIRLGAISKGENAKMTFRDFSFRLDQCTKSAAKSAFEKIIIPVYEKEQLQRYPLRPVLLGGDDMTVIIRGDLALDFTQEFLKSFQEISQLEFNNFALEHGLESNPFSDGLSACAGIAYIKSSYPFHYGVDLAENLCQVAKNVSKNINENHSPSSLMFHKVQSSFVEEYDEIIDKELTAPNNVYFNYGPYFIDRQEYYDTVDSLKSRINNLNQKSAPKSGLRNWLTELKENQESAQQLLNRISGLNPKFERTLNLKNPFVIRKTFLRNGEIVDGLYTPIFDAMSLSNINSI